ncbi:unnamed protein product, partial [Ixodes hexagonus]
VHDIGFRVCDIGPVSCEFVDGSRVFIAHFCIKVWYHPEIPLIPYFYHLFLHRGKYNLAQNGTFGAGAQITAGSERLMHSPSCLFLKLAPSAQTSHKYQSVYFGRPNIMSRETIGNWVRFNVQVIDIFKYGPSKVRRGNDFLWVPMADLACKCPKLKVKSSYLILGNEEIHDGQPGLTADKTSIVIDWKEEWGRRLRKFQRRQRKGRCKN